MAPELKPMAIGVGGNRRLKVPIAAATVTASWVALPASHGGATHWIWKLTSRRFEPKKDRRRTRRHARPEDRRVGGVPSYAQGAPLPLIWATWPHQIAPRHPPWASS